MAYRRSLEDRLRASATDSGRDLGWLRRRHVFLRVLHRLAANQPDEWVLKGGFAVELRRPGLARTTVDIDLVVRRRIGGNVDVMRVRDKLIAGLSVDVDEDSFQFSLGPGTPLADDAYGRPAWRFTVNAILAGKSFVKFHLDIVERPEELVGLTTLTLPIGVGAPPGAVVRSVVATDLRQQFAEKFHALTRSYASGESTRVKDLLDIVLLVDDGLIGDAELHMVVRRVFAVRGTSELPTVLGVPPLAWANPFQRMAVNVGLPDMTAVDAGKIASETWLDACQAVERREI
jgi:hypothetical protein